MLEQLGHCLSKNVIVCYLTMIPNEIFKTKSETETPTQQQQQKTHDKKRDQPKNNYFSLDFNKVFLTKNMLLHI